MSSFATRAATALVVCAICCAGNRAQGWHHLGDVQNVETLKDGIILTAGTARVRITAVRDGIVRVRVAPNGKFPERFFLGSGSGAGSAGSFHRGGHEGSAHDCRRYSCSGKQEPAAD